MGNQKDRIQDGFDVRPSSRDNLAVASARVRQFQDFMNQSCIGSTYRGVRPDQIGSSSQIHRSGDEAVCVLFFIRRFLVQSLLVDGFMDELIG